MATKILKIKRRHPTDNSWMETEYITNDKKVHQRGVLADPDAVDTTNIVDGAVTQDKLGSKAVTTEKIADGAITLNKIDSTSIHSTSFTASLVTGTTEDYLITISYDN